MPLYDFECETCGTKEEHIQKHTDPMPKCPQCAAEMRRLPGSSNFAYVTKGGHLTGFMSNRQAKGNRRAKEWGPRAYKQPKGA